MKEELFKQLVKSIKQMGKISRNQMKAGRTFKQAKINVRTVRKNINLSQTEFAMMLGVSCRTLQNWEQERRTPTGSALALLTIFKNDPKHAINALHARH